MKPVKNLESTAKWLLRIAVVAYLLSTYFLSLKTLHFESPAYLITFAFVLSGVLLFFGGFQKSSNLTIISAVVLVVLAVYKIYPLVISVDSLLHNTAIYVYLLLVAVGAFFISKGNG